VLIDVCARRRPPGQRVAPSARSRPIRPVRGALLWLLLLASPARADSPGLPLLVTIGEVTDSTAVVWTRAPAAGAVQIAWEAEDRPGRAQLEITVRGPEDLTGKARLTALAPGTRYRYTVTQGSAAVRGEFLTAPPPERPAAVSFAWSGDLGSRGHCRHVLDGYRIFRPLRDATPDFFLFVGDTIYADHVCTGPDRVPGSDFVATTLEEFRAKHRYNRADHALQEFFRATSVYAIWDDHEVRNDFSGPTEPLMAPGRRAFLEYFPILPPPGEPGRLYRRFRWGSLLEVFILDTRQYRSPNAEPDGPRKTMLGAAQRRWLVEGVAASAAVWKVVVSSVSLSVPTGRRLRDSWTGANVLGLPEERPTGFAHERDGILRALRDRQVRNLVVLTADVHHAEVLRHAPAAGFMIHELIAGPLSASTGRPRPVDASLDPRTLFALGGVPNFGLVTVDAAGFTVRVIDVDGRQRFAHTISAER
jgi:alkaline phosphatase D